MDFIWILTRTNDPGGAKFHFSQEFAKALGRRGIKTRIIDLNEKNLKQELINSPILPDLCCSFSHFPPWESIWNRFNIPIWIINLSSWWWIKNLHPNAYTILSFVDQHSIEEMVNKGFRNVFFWGHAVEIEAKCDETTTRPYDIVFLGSCYDPEGKGPHVKPRSQSLLELIREASSLFLSDLSMTIEQAVLLSSKNHPFAATKQNHEEIYRLIDIYVRGYDRVELIRSIKNIPVHVFGGKTDEWSWYFNDSPNVIPHRKVSFAESLDIMRKNKICLNSMPFLKNGTHERLFGGMISGCLMITTENFWVKEYFTDGEELILYKPFHWSEAYDKIHFYLTHEKERLNIAQKGKEKVIKNHTWDNRVAELLLIMPPILAQIKTINSHP